MGRAIWEIYAEDNYFEEIGDVPDLTRTHS